MLDAKDYPPGSKIYTFVADDGTNTHVDSEKLREWCAANQDRLEVVPTPVDPKIAMSFLTENSVDLNHIKRILSMPHLDPIIYGKTGTSSNGCVDVLLIDGHHRYFCAFCLKVKWIPGYLLTPEQWQPFQIAGLPDLTQPELASRPLGKGAKPCTS